MRNIDAAIAVSLLVVASASAGAIQPCTGHSLLGDYQSQRMWGLTQEQGVLKKVRQIGRAPQRIVSFGRGENGELFLVGYEGTIYKIDFNGAEFE